MNTQLDDVLRDRLHRLADHAPTSVVLPGELRLVAQQPSEPKRRWLKFGVPAVALLAGGSISLAAARQGDTDRGAASPSEAVLDLVAAVEDEDLLGVIATMDPAEVDALHGLLDATAADARRVGLLADGFSLDGVDGVDVSVDGLELATEDVADGLTVVTATAGTMAASFDPATFPMGDDLRQLLGSEPTPASGSSPVPSFAVATVEHDGRWFVSLGYTLGELLRRNAGEALLLAPTTTPEGFDSPEAVAQEFYRRLADLDVGGMAAMAAPGEGDALARYLPIWLSRIERGVADIHAQGLAFDLGAVTVKTDGTSDHRTVTATGYTYDATVPDYAATSGQPFDPSLPTLVYQQTGSQLRTFRIPAGVAIPATVDGLQEATPDGWAEMSNTLTASPDGTITQPVAAGTTPEPLRLHVEFADGCLKASGTALDRASSPDAQATDADGCILPSLYGGLLSIVGVGAVPELPRMATVQVDGQWYLSPIGTLGGAFTQVLRDTEPGTLASLDGPLAPALFGTNRSMLAAQYTGMARSDIPAECMPILTFGPDGTVTGVAAEPARADVRACADLGYSTTSTGSASSEPAVAVEVPASSAAPTPETTAP